MYINVYIGCFNANREVQLYELGQIIRPSHETVEFFAKCATQKNVKNVGGVQIILFAQTVSWYNDRTGFITLKLSCLVATYYTTHTL